MKVTKLMFLLPPMILCSVVPSMAGDPGYSQCISTSARFHSKWDNQPHAIRILGYPFVFLGGAGESFLHSPQILSEAIEGERPLVSRRGVLAPRDMPVEDCIISPAD